jgi:hypothetical protein
MRYKIIAGKLQRKKQTIHDTGIDVRIISNAYWKYFTLTLTSFTVTFIELAIQVKSYTEENHHQTTYLCLQI